MKNPLKIDQEIEKKGASYQYQKIKKQKHYINRDNENKVD